MYSTYFYMVLLLICIFAACDANPKKYDSNNSGFTPTIIDTVRSERKDSESAADRTQRFGVSTGYAGNPYVGGPGGAPGLYGPLKIDLGGVVLGTLIGLGAVLVLPKLAHIFSSGLYGGPYARSDDTATGFSNILSDINDTLEKYNIDSASCMQRVVCTTVQNARINSASGTPTTVDQWVQSLTKNNLFSNMLDGTMIKRAVDAGWRSDQNACELFTSTCDINKQTLMQMLSNALPS